jgi:hypothetical protein
MSQPGVRKGALIFKGDSKAVGAKPKTFRPKVELPRNEFQRCQGRIVSNGTTVQGLETMFKDELEVGDFIVVRNPQSLIKEERIVKTIVSQRSLTIDRPFSTDFVSTTEFSVKRESKTTGQDVKAEEAHASLSSQETKPTGSRNVLVYQEKRGPMGYRTVAEELDRDYTEEELLDMKCKKVHDKYC